jgi:hypothetical protein
VVRRQDVTGYPLWEMGLYLPSHSVDGNRGFVVEHVAEERCFVGIPRRALVEESGSVNWEACLELVEVMYPGCLPLAEVSWMV